MEEWREGGMDWGFGEGLGKGGIEGLGEGGKEEGMDDN